MYYYSFSLGEDPEEGEKLFAAYNTAARYALSKISNNHKDLHNQVSKVGKAIDRVRYIFIRVIKKTKTNKKSIQRTKTEIRFNKIRKLTFKFI